jgi:hypothetical protein
MLTFEGQQFTGINNVVEKLVVSIHSYPDIPSGKQYSIHNSYVCVRVYLSNPNEFI